VRIDQAFLPFDHVRSHAFLLHQLDRHLGIFSRTLLLLAMNRTGVRAALALARPEIRLVKPGPSVPEVAETSPVAR